MYLAESLSRETNGYCVTRIVNILQEDITIDSPHGELEETENDHDATRGVALIAKGEDSVAVKAGTVSVIRSEARWRT